MSPVEAIRGLLRSSTAVDPEPTAQTDPELTFLTGLAGGPRRRKADDQLPAPGR